MPLRNQIRTDKLLSNVSVKYRNEEYIADKVFPIVPVKHSTDLYRIYDRNFRLPQTLRADKAEAREHNFDVSTASYALERHSLKGFVGSREAENYEIGDLRADMTEELKDVILRRMEKSVADLFTTTSWSLNVSLAAANAFNANTTVSDPVPVFDTGATTVINNGGVKPNFAVIPRDAMVAIKNHTSVLDRIKYTSAEVTQKMFGALIDTPEILVPMSVLDTADLGATSSISAIYGDVAFLGYKPAKAGPLKPSAGYIFKNSAPETKRYRVEERDSDAIEVNVEYQAKVVASLAGYLIKDVI